MQLRMTNCLMAWCTNPNTTVFFVYLTRSCNHNCDNLGHMGCRKKLLKPGLHLVPLLLWISMLCWVRPWWVWVFFSVLLYSISRHLIIIFICLHAQFLLLWRGLPGGRQESNLSPLCHFTVYASRRLYAINKLPARPHATSVTMSVIMYMQIGGDKSNLKCFILHFLLS